MKQTIELKYVDHTGTEVSHLVPAKGHYGISVGSGSIVNAGTMTVTSGYCDYTNGIENLATAGKHASLENSGTLELLGGNSSEDHPEYGVNGAYALNNLAYGDGAEGTITNTGSLIIRGGTTQFRYGIQTLAFNESEEADAQETKAFLINTGRTEISGASSLNSVGIFVLASGATAKASVVDNSSGENGICIIGGSAFDHEESSEKAAYGIFAFALNGGHADFTVKENANTLIQGGSGTYSHGVHALSKQSSSDAAIKNLGNLRIIGGSEENAHGIFALSREEAHASITNSGNGELTIEGGSKNLTSGIHSLASEKGTAELDGEGGVIAIKGSSENVTDAYGIRYMSRSGGEASITNTGAQILISGGSLGTNEDAESANETQYRNYGIYVLASNADSSKEGEDLTASKAEINNASELRILAGNSSNAYGIYAFTEGLSEAVVRNSGKMIFQGEDSISVSAVRYMNLGADGSKAQIINETGGELSIVAGNHTGSYGIYSMLKEQESSSEAAGSSEASITNSGQLSLLGGKLGYAIGTANGSIVNELNGSMLFDERPIESLTGSFENFGSITTPSEAMFDQMEITKRDVNAELKLAASDGSDKSDTGKFKEIEETGVASSAREDWKAHFVWKDGKLTINNYRDGTLEAAKLRELAKEAWNIDGDSIVFTGTAGIVSSDLVLATQGLNHTTLHMMFDNNQLADGDVILQFVVKDGQASTALAPYDARNDAVLISNKETTIQDGGVDDVTSRQNIGFTHIINSTAISVSHDLKLRLTGLTDGQWDSDADKIIAENDVNLNRGTLILGLEGEENAERNGKLQSVLGSTGSLLEVVNGSYEINDLKSIDAANHGPDLQISAGALKAAGINTASALLAEDAVLSVTNDLVLSGGSVRNEESRNAGTITAAGFKLNKSSLTEKGTQMVNTGSFTVSGSSELLDSVFLNEKSGTFETKGLSVQDSALSNSGSLSAEQATVTVSAAEGQAFIDNLGTLSINKITVGENAYLYNQKDASAVIADTLNVNGLFGDYGNSEIQNFILGASGTFVFNKEPDQETKYTHFKAESGARIDLVSGTLELEKIDGDNIVFTQHGGALSVAEGWFKNSEVNIYGGVVSIDELGENNVYTVKGTGTLDIGKLSDSSLLYLYSDGVVDAEKLDYTGDDKKFYLEGGTLLTDVEQIFNDVAYEAIDIDTDQYTDVSLSNIISDVGGIKGSVSKALNFNYGVLAFRNDFSNEQVYSKILKEVNTTADSVGNKIFVAFNNAGNSDNGLRNFTLDTLERIADDAGGKLNVIFLTEKLVNEKTDSEGQLSKPGHLVIGNADSSVFKFADSDSANYIDHSFGVKNIVDAENGVYVTSGRTLVLVGNTTGLLPDIQLADGEVWVGGVGTLEPEDSTKEPGTEDGPKDPSEGTTDQPNQDTPPVAGTGDASDGGSAGSSENGTEGGSSVGPSEGGTEGGSLVGSGESGPASGGNDSVSKEPIVSKLVLGSAASRSPNRPEGYIGAIHVGVDQNGSSVKGVLELAKGKFRIGTLELGGDLIIGAGTSDRWLDVGELQSRADNSIQNAGRLIVSKLTGDSLLTITNEKDAHILIADSSGFNNGIQIDNAGEFNFDFLVLDGEKSYNRTGGTFWSEEGSDKPSFVTVKGEGFVNEEGAVLVTDLLTVESALENAGTINLKKDLDVSASASYVQTGGSVLAPTLTNKGSFALEGGSARFDTVSVTSSAEVSSNGQFFANTVQTDGKFTNLSDGIADIVHLNLNPGACFLNQGSLGETDGIFSGKFENEGDALFNELALNSGSSAVNKKTMSAEKLVINSGAGFENAGGIFTARIFSLDGGRLDTSGGSATLISPDFNSGVVHVGVGSELHIGEGGTPNANTEADTAVLVSHRRADIGESTKLIVGTLENEAQINNGDVYFGADSLLRLDAESIKQGYAAIRSKTEGAKLYVKKGAKIETGLIPWGAHIVTTGLDYTGMDEGAWTGEDFINTSGKPGLQIVKRQNGNVVIMVPTEGGSASPGVEGDGSSSWGSGEGSGSIGGNGSGGSNLTTNDFYALSGYIVPILLKEHLATEENKTATVDRDVMNSILLVDQFKDHRQAVHLWNSMAGMSAVSGLTSFALEQSARSADLLENHLSMYRERYKKADLWVEPYGSMTRHKKIHLAATDGGYKGNVYGISMGLQYGYRQQSVIGGAFHYAKGDLKSTGEFTKNSSDSEYMGFSLYGAQEYGHFNLVAQASYSEGKGNSSQNFTAADKHYSATANLKVKQAVLGLRGEFLFKPQKDLHVLPHFGVRYIRTDAKGYAISVNGERALDVSSDKMGTIQLPLGIAVKSNIHTDSAWNIKPTVDMSVIPQFGDVDSKLQVRTATLSSIGTYEYTVSGRLLLNVKAGIEARNRRHSFGAGYSGYAGVKGSITHSINASYTYTF